MRAREDQIIDHIIFGTNEEIEDALDCGEDIA
jgi:hypothetical protein